MDSIDLSIVEILQDDGRITMKELGQRVGLTSPAAIERVKKLEETGIIAGYRAIINLSRSGLGVHVFLLVTLHGQNYSEFNQFAVNDRDILACHRVAGSSEYLLEAAIPDIAGLENLVNRLSGHGRVETFVVLSSPIQNKTVAMPDAE